MSSLISQRKLGEATDTLSKVYERLSSGQRINRASDDAAGLAIAEDLNAKSKIYTQGIRNGNDGISLLNIADSALDSLSSIVTRIRELSEQAANGSYSNQQRQALDIEAQQLSKEFTRIAQTASFNGINIFNGSLGKGLALQLGIGSEASLTASIGGAIGTGTFGAQTQYSTGHSIGSSMGFAVGDLNGDGIMDVVANGLGGSHPLQIRLGNGDGTLGAPISYADGGGSAYRSLALGDINGDGILDIVAAWGSGSGTILTSRLGNGDGTFGAAQDRFLGYAVSDLQLGDLNGDGILDIIASEAVIVYSSESGSIKTMLGNGNGTFGSEYTLYADHFGSPVFSLGDFNGDGILDIVTAGSSSDGYIKVRAGNGNGTFGATIMNRYVYPSGHGSVTVGDLNGDGHLDIIATGSPVGANGYLTTILGNGDGTFQSTWQQNLGAMLNDIALADLDGDGILDAVAVGGNKASVHRGLGNGSFSSAVLYTAETGGSMRLALEDMNGDGIADLVSLGLNAGNSGRISIRLSNTEQGIGPLEKFSLKTEQEALQAMSMLDKKLDNLSRQKGVIGASQSRIAIAISSLQSAKENFNVAESRIRDADIAAESANLIRTQIIQQAATAVLAQANQAPALALELLNGTDNKRARL